MVFDFSCSSYFNLFCRRFIWNYVRISILTMGMFSLSVKVNSVGRHTKKEMEMLVFQDQQARSHKKLTLLKQ